MIEKNISLRTHNTFGLEVKAANFLKVQSVRALKDVLQENTLPISILGGGSNILMTKDVDGLLLKNELKGKHIVRQSQKGIEVEVASAENWHEFVRWCLDNHLAGIENLSLIPGTVGAAPIQNIGAYGVELNDVLISVEALELKTGTLKTFEKEECQLGYRDSIFKKKLKGQYFITKVTLLLQPFHKAELNTSYGAIHQILTEKKIDKPTPKDISEVVIAIRQSKLPDPKELGNAGSFFKNPVIAADFFKELQNLFPNIIHYDLGNGQIKIPAGWLIENTGWKGKKVGNTGTHAAQALVLVNYGNATGTEIKQLSEEIIATVYSKYGILLEREVNIW